MPLLVLITMVVLGLTGIAFGAVRLRRDLDLLRRGTRVPGEVVGLLTTDLGHGPPTHAPVVRFRTAEGREVTATPGRWRQSAFRPAGGPVTVVHDPSRPSRVLVEAPGYGGAASVVVPFVVLLGASLIVLVTGLVVFLRLS